LVDVNTLPAASVATHNALEGHEIAVSGVIPSTFVGLLQAGRPPFGFVEVSTFPALSTATHNDAEGHDTPRTASVVLSIVATAHAVRPPVGLVDVTTSPNLSPATHSELVGHEMDCRAMLPSTLVTVHVPLDGAVVVTTWPATSTPTHRVVPVGHEMPEIV
jgi:hypothetical protein